MKKHLNKKGLCLAGAALLLAGSVTVGSAMAYFTTYATASGGAQISLGFTETVPREEFPIVDWTKRISVENTGTVDCFVRVKIFAGEKFREHLDQNISGESWTKGQEPDGNGYYYYYYDDVVPAGESTQNQLTAHIDNMESTEDFNVIVVQESTPVLYDADGSPYADWNVVLDSVQNSYN